MSRPPPDWIYAQALSLSNRKDANSVGALAWNLLVAFGRWEREGSGEAVAPMTAGERSRETIKSEAPE